MTLKALSVPDWRKKMDKWTAKIRTSMNESEGALIVDRYEEEGVRYD